MKTLSTNNLIIGLGNYGQDFDGTRHNVGFAIVDALNSKKQKWVSNETYLSCYNQYLNSTLIKSTTGMNSSGIAVKQAITKYRPQNIILIYDDMDFDVGAVRIKVGGSSGRHNGVQSVIDNIGSDFIRVRVGIGKPQKNNGIDFVLGLFSGKEKDLIKEGILLATEAVSWITKDGINKAMCKFNERK